MRFAHITSSQTRATRERFVDNVFRALFFSDIHIDAVTAGRSRRHEILGFLERVFHIADQEQVDLVAFAGDAHDPGTLSDGLLCADLMRRFLMFPRARSSPAFVAIAGNHDVFDIGEYFMDQPVTTLTPIRSATHFIPREHAELVHVFDRPMTRLVKPGLAVLALPYVSRVHVDKLPTWEAHALNVARGYVEQGNKLVVIGHRVIPGARMTSESTEMARGQDQIFPFAEVAALKPAFVVNGHYHAHQTVMVEGLEIHIPGSPIKFTFGESEEDSKGALFAVI